MPVHKHAYEVNSPHEERAGDNREDCKNKIERVNGLLGCLIDYPAYAIENLDHGDAQKQLHNEGEFVDLFDEIVHFFLLFVL